MIHWRTHFFPAVAAVLLAGLPLYPQTPPLQQPAAPAPPKPLPAFYRNLIVIDPAHGGNDSGAHLSNSTSEKETTLAFAQRLKPALVAQGFTVITTRDSDPSDELTTDQRAGTSNHARPLACIVLHAAPAGSGIHIFSSSLPAESVSPGRALPWNKAQAPVLPMSLRLANEIGLALNATNLPAQLFRASVPPLDNLTCSAIAIELAPLKSASGSSTPATDTSYQQRAVNAIAAGIASFRTHNAPPPSPATSPATAPRPGATP